MHPRTAAWSDTGSIPNTLTLPDSARHNPSRCLIRVDLPAPFSPTSPNTHPRGTASVTSFKDWLEPKWRDRFVTTATCRDDCAGPLASSGTTLPRLPCGAAQCQLVLHQPANVDLVEIERLEAVDCRPHDGFGLFHQLRPRR